MKLKIYVLYCETVCTSPYLGSPAFMFVTYKMSSNTSGKENAGIASWYQAI